MSSYRGGRKFSQPHQPKQTIREQILTNRSSGYENWDTAISGPWANARPKQKQSHQRKEYNQKRYDNLRRREGEKSLTQVSSAVDEKYHVSAADTEKILAQLEANATIKTYTTFITTRGIGFSCAQLYFQAQKQRNPQICDIYITYRIGLAMLDGRLSTIQGTLKHPISQGALAQDINSSAIVMDITKTVNAYPDPLGRIIKNVGPFTDGGEYYVPAVAANSYHEGRFIPRSENITFSNLRQTVQALSEVETLPEVRLAFYLNNPIPGCIWRNPRNPVLQNPDEIIPPGYGPDNLRRDVNQFNSSMAWVQKKLEKFVKTDKIDYAAPGTRSLLVSNRQSGLRYPDRGEGQDLAEYYRHLQLEHNVDEYWYTTKLDNRELFEGQVNLTGEIPALLNYVNPTYQDRSIEVASWTTTSDYLAMQAIVYG